MRRRLYIAATRQNEGKTTVSLGLMASLIARGMNPCYQKPVGQRVIPAEDGTIADEDVILLKKVFDLKAHLADMSPVGIPRGFTENYIRTGAGSDRLAQSIFDALARIEAGTGCSIIEGTGHAGVGDVIDLCNARVCRLMDAAAILVTGGGIGRPIDEIAVNMALFEREDCRIVGVILNKVLPEKFDRITDLVRTSLARKSIELLGAIPSEPVLAGPTLAQIVEDTSAKLLGGDGSAGEAVRHIVLGTGYPPAVMGGLADGTLLITSGDREDLILAALATAESAPQRFSGLMLTDGHVPAESVLRRIAASPVPVISVSDDAYSAAAEVHDLMVKIRPADQQKIDLASRLVGQHVNVDRIIELMSPAGR